MQKPTRSFSNHEGKDSALIIEHCKLQQQQQFQTTEKSEFIAMNPLSDSDLSQQQREINLNVGSGAGTTQDIKVENSLINSTSPLEMRTRQVSALQPLAVDSDGLIDVKDKHNLSEERSDGKE